MGSGSFYADFVYEYNTDEFLAHNFWRLTWTRRLAETHTINFVILNENHTNKTYVEYS